MDVGVIGIGAMGRNHARVYSELKSVRYVSVYDIDQAATQKVADQYNVNACKSLDALLERSDAVSLVVPTQYHAKVAEQVFTAEKHVLIEKPICSTPVEAHNLITKIPKHITVGVGHIERFNPVVAEIQKIMKKPLYIEMKRHNPASARVTGSSVVEDLMIHDIDIIINQFFEVPGELHSVGNNDVCSVQMTYRDHVPVVLSASRKSSKKIRSIYVEEEDITIEGDFMSQEVIVYKKPGQYAIEEDRYVQENIIEKVMVNKLEPLKVELSTFINCAKTASEFPVTPAQALNNLGVCERIRHEMLGVI